MQKIADVVMVADDVAVRRALKFLLEVEGLKVRLFDGYAALLVANNPPLPCCLIIEHCLPWLDGLELVKILRTQHADLPVILFTGQPSLDLDRQAAQLGVRQILEMPFAAPELLSAALAVAKNS